MIYINFLFFIIAIALFSTAPLTENSMFTLPQDLLALLVVLWAFWHFNRYHFKTIRETFDKGNINVEEAKKYFFNRINIHIIIAIFIFAVELFVFDLKVFLARIPLLGNSETFINAAGLSFFLLQLAVIWYWGYRAMGDVLEIGKSPANYIRANVKFNLAIVLPWLVFSFFIDILSLIDSPWLDQMMNSALFQVILFALFLIMMALFAPVFITFLWDCKPLPEGELKESITSFCRAEGIGFRKIMSWNAMNRGLVTAGVIGLFRPFRYLLLTPQLMDMLTSEEILGVVSHEIGHVKKRHLLYYLLFFMGFVILSVGTIDRFIKVLLNSRFGFTLVISPDGSVNTAALSFLTVFVSLFLFVVYFRYIFGFFMRNFERQADLYCFSAGLDPNLLISSFMKLGVTLGDDGKKSNWHHYNIAQRIDFLRKSIDNPALVGQHDKKVRRVLRIFVALLILFTLVSFNPYANRLDKALDFNLMANVIEERIEKEPVNHQLYSLLGAVYYELEKWGPAKKAYQASLKLHYNQPEVLNNLAWLLVKCPEKKYRHHKLALQLAEDAIKLQEAAHIWDTLAESYLANKMYKRALAASIRAVEIAKENRKYYKDQVEKMKKMYQENKSITRI